MAAKPPTDKSQPEQKAKKSSKKATILVVVGLMVLEGAAIFTLTHFAGAVPETASAEDADKKAAEDGKHAEVELAECRPDNTVGGKVIRFQVRVSALVRLADSEKARKLAETNKDRIHDRVIFIFRSAEPAHYREPALTTIKRRLKQELDAIFGEPDIIQEILIPEFLQG